MCRVCPILDDKWTCRIICTVYKNTCKLCGNIYIGKTINPIKDRFFQHAGAIKKGDTHKSALANHLTKYHPNLSHASIAIFGLAILHKSNSPADLLIAEACFINNLKPTINRKNELQVFYQ